jgi:hypothetical protein
MKKKVSKKMSLISSLRAKSFSLLYKMSYITHYLQTYGNNTMHPLPADAYLAGRGCKEANKKTIILQGSKKLLKPLENNQRIHRKNWLNV